MARFSKHSMEQESSLCKSSPDGQQSSHGVEPEPEDPQWNVLARDIYPDDKQFHPLDRVVNFLKERKMVCGETPADDLTKGLREKWPTYPVFAEWGRHWINLQAVLACQENRQWLLVRTHTRTQEGACASLRARDLQRSQCSVPAALPPKPPAKPPTSRLAASTASIGSAPQQLVPTASTAPVETVSVVAVAVIKSAEPVEVAEVVPVEAVEVKPVATEVKMEVAEAAEVVEALAAEPVTVAEVDGEIAAATAPEAEGETEAVEVTAAVAEPVKVEEAAPAEAVTVVDQAVAEEAVAEVFVQADTWSCLSSQLASPLPEAVGERQDEPTAYGAVSCPSPGDDSFNYDSVSSISSRSGSSSMHGNTCVFEGSVGASVLVAQVPCWSQHRPVCVAVFAAAYDAPVSFGGSRRRRQQQQQQQQEPAQPDVCVGSMHISSSPSASSQVGGTDVESCCSIAWRMRFSKRSSVCRGPGAVAMCLSSQLGSATSLAVQAPEGFVSAAERYDAHTAGDVASRVQGPGQNSGQHLAPVAAWPGADEPSSLHGARGQGVGAGSQQVEGRSFPQSRRVCCRRQCVSGRVAPPRASVVVIVRGSYGLRCSGRDGVPVWHTTARLGTRTIDRTRESNKLRRQTAPNGYRRAAGAILFCSRRRSPMSGVGEKCRDASIAVTDPKRTRRASRRKPGVCSLQAFRPCFPMRRGTVPSHGTRLTAIGVDGFAKRHTSCLLSPRVAKLAVTVESTRQERRLVLRFRARSRGVRRLQLTDCSAVWRICS
ncbi:hypothetical protein PLESTB_000755900 [Pleodorina starrii]|uniref:Uncharacterized protein n=1 Tax=Pleodorina starrii TaxID=330485 RepID=A0A9W6BLB4_9CHLO|nr:hypothetical protein PLESTB_000755900 [Pleodorina starrii]